MNAKFVELNDTSMSYLCSFNSGITLYSEAYNATISLNHNTIKCSDIQVMEPFGYYPGGNVFNTKNAYEVRSF
jgi:hypothetical protein